jgi:subtilase family serine protease
LFFSSIEKVNISSGKNFLKNNKVKVESGFASSALQNMIIGGVGILIAYQLLKTIFRRKRS